MALLSAKPLAATADVVALDLAADVIPADVALVADTELALDWRSEFDPAALLASSVVAAVGTALELTRTVWVTTTVVV